MARRAEARAPVVAGADLWLAEAAIPCRPRHASISRNDLSESLYPDTRRAEEGADGAPAYNAADAPSQRRHHQERTGTDRRCGFHPRAAGRGRRSLCGANNTHIATLVERHTRFVMLLNVPSKGTATVVAALGKHVRKLPQELHRRHQRAGLFLRSTQSLAARQQREHQRLAATVFPEGNRSLALLSGVPEQDRAAAQSPPAEDLGLRNPCR